MASREVRAASSIVLLSVLVATMTMCGGGSSGGNSRSTPTPTPTATPTPAPTPTPTATPTPVTGEVPHFDHVAIVVLENAGYTDVVGNTPVMPFLNSLVTSWSSAANYFANSHPSIGNYFMMTTGTVVTNDDAFNGTVTADNLVREMAASGVSWKSYQEDIPGAGYLGGNAGKYLKRHNPFAYFSDVVNNPVESAKIVPFTQLAIDSAAGQLPNFIFITPNAEHDAHNCPSAMPSCTMNDKLAVADQWLQAHLPALIGDAAFSTNGLLVIVFDEARDSDPTNGGGHIACLLIGTHVRQGFTSTTLYQHQNLLRLIADALRVNNVPGAGASAGSMGEFFE